MALITPNITSIVRNESGGYSAIATYDLVAGANRYDFKWGTSPETMEVRLTLLTPNGTATLNFDSNAVYYISVVARNSTTSEISSDSPIVTFDTANTLPDINFSFIREATSITANYWSGGVDVDSWIFEINGVSYTSNNSTGTITFNNLTPGTTYPLNATATNNQTGTVSKSISAGTTKPATPLLKGFSKTNTSFTVYWNPPSSGNFANFRVKYGTTSGTYGVTSTIASSNNSHTITGLTPNSTYYAVLVSTVGAGKAITESYPTGEMVIVTDSSGYISLEDDSHKNSLLLDVRSVVPVDNNTAFLAHYDITANDVLSGISPLSGGIFTLRPYEGKFGGGIAVEEGTTNILSPNLATIATNSEWSCYDGYAEPYHTFGTRIDRTLVPNGYMGVSNSEIVYTLSGISSSSYGVVAWNGITGRPDGEVLTFSAMVRGIGDSIGKNIILDAYRSNTLGTLDSTKVFMLTEQWQQVSLSWTNRAGDSTHVYLLFVDSSFKFEFSQPQVESKGFATSYINGTRSKGLLRYSDSALNHAQGTLSFWYTPSIAWNDATTSNGSGDMFSENLFTWGDPGLAEALWVRRNRQAQEIQFRYNLSLLNGAYNLTGKETAMISFVWQDGLQKLFLNGQLIVTTTVPSMPRPTFGYFDVGGRNDGDYCTCNGIIDELRIDRVARSDEEIASWYYSGTPFSPRGIYTVSY